MKIVEGAGGGMPQGVQIHHSQRDWRVVEDLQKKLHTMAQQQQHCVTDIAIFTLNWPRHKTPNSTFEERGKWAVNSEKEANSLSIRRKRQIGCKFQERVDQPLVIIHPTSVAQKLKGRETGGGVGC